MVSGVVKCAVFGAAAFAKETTLVAPAPADPGAVAALSGLGLAVLIPLVIVFLVATVFFWWMFIDAIRRPAGEFRGGLSKIIWLLLMWFVGGIASIAYFFMVYRGSRRPSEPQMAAIGDFPADMPPAGDVGLPAGDVGLPAHEAGLTAAYVAPGDTQPTASKTSNRTLILVAAGVGLLLVVGIAAGAVMMFLSGQAGDEAVLPVAPGAAAPGAGKAPSVPVEPKVVSLADIYEFRDIFKPTYSTVSADDSSTASAADTLYLQDITSEDGKAKGVFLYNSVTYTLAEGEQVGDTAWEVLDLKSSSAVMLYGDIQIELWVGQGQSVDSETGAPTATK